MNLKNIYGHEQNEKQLAKLVNSTNISSTWLFHGKHGIGKRTIAYRFIAYILSECKTDDNLLTSEPIKQTLRSMICGTHPDFFLFDCRSDDVSIENYRSVAKKLYRKPAISNSKALLILGAESLTLNIYNALLKLSEEPPQNTYIIITTSNILKIPLTLRSRCAKMFFDKLERDEVKKIIHDIDASVTEEAILLADGSVGDALQFIDQSVYSEFLDSVCNASPSDVAIDAIVQKCNNADGWQFFKKCVIRFIQAVTDSSLGLDGHLLPNEQHMLRNIDMCRLSDVSCEVMTLLSKCESAKLDRSSVIKCVLRLMKRSVLS